MEIEIPMFPLGIVLFPTQLLPLHVFEPRYRAMTRDLLAGDGRFGVVLIERGNEVGGGDTRSDFGCVAQLVQARLEDRLLVVHGDHQRELGPPLGPRPVPVSPL